MNGALLKMVDESWRRDVTRLVSSSMSALFRSDAENQPIESRGV
jgi:hypothetical protein